MMISREHKIRWGILGCGQIADTFASDLSISENAILMACASNDSTRGKTFAIKHGASYFFETYEELVKNKDIDVIYIATPNSFHMEHSVLCLQNKKAVLCEKPLAINKSEAEKMMEVAHKNNTFLMEAMWTSCLPNIHKIKDTIQRGVIGEIIHLSADFGFKVDYNPKSRLFDPALGGGSLLDIGIYPLFISLLLLGKPETIHSSLRFADSGVDASCSVLLSYSEGKTAALFSSFETFTNIKCEIYGTKGKIIIDDRFHQQNEHVLVLNGLPAQVVKSDALGFGYIFEIEHVNECLYQGLKESPNMPLKYSLELLQMMDEIRR